MLRDDWWLVFRVSPGCVHPGLIFVPRFGITICDSKPPGRSLDFPTNGERGVNGYPARSYSTGDL